MQNTVVIYGGCMTDVIALLNKIGTAFSRVIVANAFNNTNGEMIPKRIEKVYLVSDNTLVLPPYN